MHSNAHMHGLHMSATVGLGRVLCGKSFAFHFCEQVMPHLPGHTARALKSILVLAGHSLRWCHTDLGANALHWPRLVREDRRLSTPAGGPDGMADDHNDGLLAQALLDAGMSRNSTALCPNFAFHPSIGKSCSAASSCFKRRLLIGCFPCLNNPDQHMEHSQ